MPFPFGVQLVSLALRISACLVVFVGVGCGRLASHPLVKEATEEVRANARVAAALGTPVECGTAVRGTANETDGIATLQFDVKGPKAAGVVVVEGKKTKNEWGVTMLELRPAGADRVSLTADLEEHTGVDTPKFDPGAAPSTPPAQVAPPADVEIALPPGPPGQ
jgi:hypothetical protein